jgi:hypothetical protein
MMAARKSRLVAVITGRQRGFDECRRHAQTHAPAKHGAERSESPLEVLRLRRGKVSLHLLVQTDQGAAEWRR